MELWLIFAISCYLSYAISTIIDKHMMNLRYNIVFVNLIKTFFNGFILLIIGFIFFAVDFTENFTLIWFIPGIIYAYSSIIYFIALSKKDVGQIIPSYQSIRLLFTFVASAIVFKEHLDGLDYFGVSLILIGSYFVLVEKRIGFFKIDKVSLLILILIPTDIINALIIKSLLYTVKPINLATFMYFSGLIFLIIFFIVNRKKITYGIQQIKKICPKILGASFFGALGTLLLFSALFFGNATKVYPLDGLSSVFVFILAIVFLKEKFYLHRLGGTIVAVMGVFLLSQV
ncbi:MAG TPA: EamA family transporter [Candidatus Lokiarchaeia archaeon]